MKQVESRGQKAATNDLHRNLHNLIAGINWKRNKSYSTKSPRLQHQFFQSLTQDVHMNLIYSFGLVEYIPKNEDGRTISWIFLPSSSRRCPSCCIFVSQGLSNMLWSYVQRWSHQTRCYSKQHQVTWLWIKMIWGILATMYLQHCLVIWITSKTLQETRWIERRRISIVFI